MPNEKTPNNPGGEAFLSTVVEKKDFKQLNPNGYTKARGEPSPNCKQGIDYAYECTFGIENGVVTRPAKYFGGNRTGE